MAIIIKDKSKVIVPAKPVKSLESIRQQGSVSAPVQKDKPARNPASIVEKLAQRAAKSNEIPPTINNGIIKPKYIEDKSVGYKKSGYVKDLLGEEI